MIKVTAKFKTMSELYKVFSHDWRDCLTYTEESLLEMFNHETHGGPISFNNGFFHGKKWLNVNVAMWKEDLEKGVLFKQELYSDPKYPAWWLDSVLGL